MRRMVIVLLALCVLTMPLCAVSHAQEIKTCVPTHTIINEQGQGADIAVGASAVGALAQNNAACQRLLRNNGAAPMRCMSIPQGTPTATAGLLLNSGDQILMGTEGREAWRCIRTTSTSTTATTIEGIP